MAMLSLARMPYPIQFSYPFLLTFMTETTNSQAKKSSDGTSTQSKDLVDLPEDILKAIQYLEYRRLRHKHPHC